MPEIALNKCPKHPNQSGPSDFGGRYCWGNERNCKWAHKEFVNEDEDGNLTKVEKWRPAAGGKWLTREDYISQLDGAEPEPEAPSEAPRTFSDGLTAKDRLMARMNCINAAANIYAACVTAGIYKSAPEAEEVMAYAEAIENLAQQKLWGVTRT